MREAELTIVVQQTWNLTTPVSHSSCVFIGQFKRKPLESCEKDVKKLSKINRKLYQVATVRSAALFLRASKVSEKIKIDSTNHTCTFSSSVFSKTNGESGESVLRIV